MKLVAGCAVVIVVWLQFAPSLQLMLLHDDTGILLGLSARNILDVFESRPGDALYRPLSYLPWLLTRDWFGWYQHALIHFWNVAGHTLNAALVFALAALPGTAFPVLAGLLFALYPFSYQDVLWASAVVHPFMLLFSLGAVHAYLTATRSKRPGRWLALSVAFIIAACLSHEMGFLAGALVFLTEGLRAAIRHEPLRPGAFLALAVGAAYPLLYRAFLSSQWVETSGFALRDGLAGLPSNMIYFMQGMAWWVVLLLRDQIGLTPERFTLVTALFILSVATGLFVMWRLRIALLGAYALAWWLACALVVSFFLPAGYLYTGPRLLYLSSVGVALFWSALLAAVLQRLLAPRPPRRVTLATRAAAGLLLVLTGVVLAWNVPFITARITETARLTPAMKMLDADLSQSKPEDTVLVINQPTWNSPFRPAFPIGTEGMVIFAQYGFPWEWVYGVSGVKRDTAYARFEPSIVKSGAFDYDVAGTPMDDNAIRQAILNARLVYRFDFDDPGVRVQRLARISPQPQAEGDYLARFSNDAEQALVRSARATRCGNRLQLDVTWSDVRGMDRPMGVFVHGHASAAGQIFSADKDLVDGHLGLHQIPPQTSVAEVRMIATDASTSVDEVRIGTYFAATGQRLRAWRPDGSEWANNEVVIPVTTGACGAVQP